MTKSADFRNQILAKAEEDGDFRARLLDDPLTVIGSELEVKLPDALEVHVHEDGPNAVNLVLPPKTRLGEADLQNVHGGMEVYNDTLW